VTIATPFDLLAIRIREVPLLLPLVLLEAWPPLPEMVADLDNPDNRVQNNKHNTTGSQGSFHLLLLLVPFFFYFQHNHNTKKQQRLKSKR